MSPTEAIQLIDGLATDLFDQRDPTAADRYCRPTNSADPVLNREEQS